MTVSRRYNNNNNGQAGGGGGASAAGAAAFCTLRDAVCGLVGASLTLVCHQVWTAANAGFDNVDQLLLLTSSISSSSNNHNNNNNIAAPSTAFFNAQTTAQGSDGFHPLHIYFGNNDLETSTIPAEKFWVPPSSSSQLDGWVEPGTRSWFSQHGQDVAVMYALDFPRDGFFVDLAANDAIWASNTYTLEQHFAWRGICIEANPIYWHKLGFRHCHAVGAIVGKTRNEKVQVQLSPDKVQAPYGGLIGAEFDNKKAGKNKAAAVDRYTVPLVQILEKFQAPAVIDYLSLDVEGAEWFIMKDFDFSRYTFKTLTIERPSAELQALLQSHGYQKVMEIARGDTLWAHSSVYEAAVQRTQEESALKNIQQHKVPNLPRHAKPS